MLSFTGIEYSYGVPMSNSSTLHDVQTFISSQNAAPLKEGELQKLEDYTRETLVCANSALGMIFVRFKKILQESKFSDGVKKLFASDVSWDEGGKFVAFKADFKAFDDLSNYYGNQYRGSFVLIYLLGALAVLAALVPVGFAFEEHFGHDAHHLGTLFTVIELFLILTILLVNRVGTNPHGGHSKTSILGFRLNRRWHERWIEYRILAERFRYMEILYPIGINPLKDGAAKKSDLGEWINAYFSMRLTQVQSELAIDRSAHKARLKQVMQEQATYHKENAHRCEHIYHRLHTVANWLFYGTLIACASHFIWHNPILTLAAGFFPALAAAMHGILANGEFSKAADISERMHEAIEELIKRLDESSGEDEIKNIAVKFHNIVLGEALSWRAMFKDKNVPLA